MKFLKSHFTIKNELYKCVVYLIRSHLSIRRAMISYSKFTHSPISSLPICLYQIAAHKVFYNKSIETSIKIKARTNNVLNNNSEIKCIRNYFASYYCFSVQIALDDHYSLCFVVDFLMR